MSLYQANIIVSAADEPGVMNQLASSSMIAPFDVFSQVISEGSQVGFFSHSAQECEAINAEVAFRKGASIRAIEGHLHTHYTREEILAEGWEWKGFNIRLASPRYLTLTHWEKVS
ncbi:hypothetical protein CCAX7_36280 [Capsulimonas corticalis]|uniref:Uncharacterized protein n=1 Tax=Capsulimonas corticalis TaxID=2219043 RepID=A0A402D6X4_9BACT|nr:hypothetical protein [Capsulimonas corticalis]BDI31577.1 hypothetical protein CCAX7_36280 [Capsulimonas corticalis]